MSLVYAVELEPGDVLNCLGSGKKTVTEATYDDTSFSDGPVMWLRLQGKCSQVFWTRPETRFVRVARHVSGEVDVPAAIESGEPTPRIGSPGTFLRETPPRASAAGNQDDEGTSPTVPALWCNTSSPTEKGFPPRTLFVL